MYGFRERRDLNYHAKTVSYLSRTRSDIRKTKKDTDRFRPYDDVADAFLNLTEIDFSYKNAKDRPRHVVYSGKHTF